MPLPSTEVVTPAKPAQSPISKKQTLANNVRANFAAQAKWKSLIAEAHLVWPKIAVEQLALVGGNFHKLAGLVQLAYRQDRQESDRQVKEFFDKHYTTA